MLKTCTRRQRLEYYNPLYNKGTYDNTTIHKDYRYSIPVQNDFKDSFTKIDYNTLINYNQYIPLYILDQKAISNTLYSIVFLTEVPSLYLSLSLLIVVTLGLGLVQYAAVIYTEVVALGFLNSLTRSSCPLKSTLLPLLIPYYIDLFTSIEGIYKRREHKS